MLNSKERAKKRREKEKLKKQSKTPEELKKQEEIISSISDPNPWTPEKEDRWLKQSAGALERRFPPMKKPQHISRQGKRSGQ